jgi:hypothetical protein
VIDETRIRLADLHGRMIVVASAGREGKGEDKHWAELPRNGDSTVNREAWTNISSTPLADADPASYYQRRWKTIVKSLASTRHQGQASDNPERRLAHGSGPVLTVCRGKRQVRMDEGWILLH